MARRKRRASVRGQTQSTTIMPEEVSRTSVGTKIGSAFATTVNSFDDAIDAFRVRRSTRASEARTIGPEREIQTSEAPSPGWGDKLTRFYDEHPVLTIAMAAGTVMLGAKLTTDAAVARLRST